jgi:hypothetical protein
MPTVWSRDKREVKITFDPGTGKPVGIKATYRDAATDSETGKTLPRKNETSVQYEDLTEAQRAKVDSFVLDVWGFVATTDPLPN